MDINNKIALVTDSSCDLPEEIIKKYEIYRLPLKIIYEDGEYEDGVTITPKEVYDRLEKEVPKTSLPCAKDVINLFNSLKNKGYTKILSVMLSSGLSGTHDMIKLLSKDFTDIQVEVFDTKSISIGSGLQVYQAAKYIAQGLNLEQIKQKLLEARDQVKVFYCLSVLDYLRKGGRIGLVTATLGSIMDLKPIISVNNEGKYYTAAKVRGRKKSLEKLIEIATDIAKGKKVNIAVLHGAAEDEAKKIKDILSNLSNIQEMIFGQISPALGVHTGPGLVGVAVQIIE